MVHAKLHSNNFKIPVSIAAALWYPNALDMKEAFVSKIASLKCSSKWSHYDFKKGSLLSTKAVLNVVYNPDGST